MRTGNHLANIMRRAVKVWALPALLMFAACLPACAYLQPPAPVRTAVPQSVPAAVMPSAPVAAPQPAPVRRPEPLPLPPDYTYLEGHSSRSVAVPVAPVEVEDLEPVNGN